MNEYNVMSQAYSNDYGVYSQDSHPVRGWTSDESVLLSCLIKQYCKTNKIEDPSCFSAEDWRNIAQQFPSKNIDDVTAKWKANSKSPKYKKSSQWTLAEDELLYVLVSKLGSKRWQCIATEVNNKVWQGEQLRKGKQ